MHLISKNGVPYCIRRIFRINCIALTLPHRIMYRTGGLEPTASVQKHGESHGGHADGHEYRQNDGDNFYKASVHIYSCF